MITRVPSARFVSSLQHTGFGIDWALFGDVFSQVAPIAEKTAVQLVALTRGPGTQTTISPSGAIQTTNVSPTGFPTLQSLTTGTSTTGLLLLGGLVIVGLLIATRSRS